MFLSPGGNCCARDLGQAGSRGKGSLKEDLGIKVGFLMVLCPETWEGLHLLHQTLLLVVDFQGATVKWEPN